LCSRSARASFCPNWKEQLEKNVEQDIVFAVNSIVDNRHSIAHGVDVGMTFGRIKDYYEKSLKLLKIIEKQRVG